MERRATAATPGYDIFPIDEDANAAMQTVMNSKWGNILGDIGAAASLALFRYKYVVKPGRPAAFTSLSVTDSLLTANAGLPFSKVVGPAVSDRVTLRYTDNSGLVREVTGLIVSAIGGSGASISVTAGSICPNIIAEPTFATVAKWTLGADWTHHENAHLDAAAADANVSQASGDFLSAPVVGRYYTVTFDITNYSAGSILFTFGGVTGEARSSNATHSQTVLLGSVTDFVLNPTGFTGTIDNVYIKEWTPTADTTAEVELEATNV